MFFGLPALTQTAILAGETFTMSVANFLTVEFNAIARRIRTAKIAVGMITSDKFEFFLRSVPRTADIRVICGVHMATPPAVMQRLKALTDTGSIYAQVFTGRFFHPKLYLFELDNEQIAFVGSGNFTNGGWQANKELFVKVTEPVVMQQLVDVFREWQTAAKPINDRFLALYAQSFRENAPNYTLQKAVTERLIDEINDNLNITNVNFTEQFFSREEYEAFAPGKTHLDTPEVLAERDWVRRALYDLNALLVPRFPRTWDIHAHYEPEHIVASPWTERHHDGNVRGLWVGYGRSREALKRYGEDATPLNFMRMQVIIKYDSIGVWLMPGKSGGGWVDREHFARELDNEVFRTTFISALRSLDSDYFLNIGGRKRMLREFTEVQALYEALREDNWRYFYFTIGRDYPLGTADTERTRFVGTVIRDFTLLFPLYEMIRDKTFDSVARIR